MSPPLCLLTVWVGVVGDPDPEALARGGDVEAHQRRVLARDEPSLPLRGRARAHRPRPGKVKIRAANNPSVFTITEKAPAKTKMIVKTDGSFAALIKLVIMLMVLPLLQRVRVVCQAREHITIQLPAVKHLQHSVKTTSPQHPAPATDHHQPGVAVHVHVEQLHLHQHVGHGDQVEAAGLGPPVAGVVPHPLLAAGHRHAVLQLPRLRPAPGPLVAVRLVPHRGAAEVRVE